MNDITKLKKQLNYYYNLLRKSKRSFVCPTCKIPMTPKAFENHCSSVHNIQSKTTCVWCRRVSWSSGEKHHHSDHLLDCFRRFVKPTEIRSTTPTPKLLSTDHQYPERDNFDHELAADDEALHFQSPLEVDPYPVQFRDSNLNLAASYVSKYLETKNTHDWFHIMVKPLAFESFATTMNENREYCRMLPFSCWCDGGRQRLAEHRQHRHMIVVSQPKGYFQERMWSRVECSSPPYHNFPCKRLKKIVSPLHLVNTLGYLSHRKSRCDFTFKSNSKKAARDNHFHLYLTLPKCYKLCLVLLWDKGILQLFYQELGQNVSIPRLVDGGPLTRVDRQWRQKLKHFYKLERGMILPIEKRFLPSQEPTDVYLHLIDGSKLYFRLTEEDLDDETWSNEHVRGGNCFYEAVQEATWIPRKRDQEILNYYKPLVDKSKELESAMKESELVIKKISGELDESKRKTNKLSERLEMAVQELEELKRHFKGEESKNKGKRKKYTIIYSEEEEEV